VFDRIVSGSLSLILLVLFSAWTSASAADGKLGDYPSKPIRMIVGNAPGGGGDILARAIGSKLNDKWGWVVVVENRAGASGAISLQLAASATPDGYTLYVGGNQITTATVQKRVPFDIRTAYTPIVQLTSQPYLLLVVPSLNVSSVKDLITLARNKPASLNYASSGYGTATHLSTELLKSLVNIDVTHVPYKGIGQALIDMLGERIHFAFVSTLSSAPHLKSGRLRVIAVSSLTRARAFPDLPTVSESGVPGFELTNAFGLYGPAKVSPAVAAFLNREVSQVMNSPEMKARLAAEGTEAVPPKTPREFQRTFIEQVDKWEKFVKTSGIKVTDK